MWADKYAPKSLDELSIHPKISETLKKLCKHKDLPHIIFYGNSGGGKSTRIECLIKEIFKGEKIVKRAETITNPDMKLNINVIQSNYHLELNCYDLGTKDKVIVQNIIKDLCSFKSSASFFSKSPVFRIFVFKDAEYLSESAQAGLRRTLETYIRNARVILHIEHLSKIIEPLKSRCICIRVPLPTEEEICHVLKKICDNESAPANIASPEFLKELINTQGRNLRKCIMALELCVYSNKKQAYEILCANEIYIKQLCDHVFTNPSFGKVKEFTTKIQELLLSQVPTYFIFEKIIKYLLKRNLDYKMKCQLVYLCAHFSFLAENSMDKSIHITAFIVNSLGYMAKYGQMKK